MNTSNRIKTHFDEKILIFFILFFLVSCLLLAYKKSVVVKCNLNGFLVESKTYRATDLITFTDTTKNASNWEWNFGDETAVSNLSKTAHSFINAGTYKIKLSLGNSCYAEKEIKILPFKKSIDNSLIPVFSCPSSVVEGTLVKLTDQTKHAKSWKWKFGETNKFDSTDKNPSYTFTTSGVKKITLTVNDDFNYIQTKTIIVTKKPETVIKAAKKTITKIIVGPEVKGITEIKLELMMRGISENKLSYRNFSKNFCKYAMPEVVYRGEKIMSLKEMDEDIRDNSIRIKKVKIEKDQDGCVTKIEVDYRK